MKRDKLKIKSQLTFLNILFLLACALLVLPLNTFAVLDVSPFSVRGRGMGCQLVAEDSLTTSRISNPSAGTWADSWSFSAYAYRQWDLPDLDRIGVLASIPMYGNGISVSMQSFGGDLYSEQSLNLQVSRPILNSFALGIEFGVDQVAIQNYGDDRAVHLTVGTLYRSRNWNYGLTGRNLWRTEFDRYGAASPRQITVGVLTKIAPEVRLAGELEFIEDRKTSFASGVEWMLFNDLSVRGGYRSPVSMFYLGIGLNWSAFSIDGSFDNHPRLGWTKGYGISVNASKQEAAD